MTQIGSEYYWDGGLFNNTPLTAGYRAARPSPSVRLDLFVVKLFPNQGDVPQYEQVFDRILENGVRRQTHPRRRDCRTR